VTGRRVHERPHYVASLRRAGVRPRSPEHAAIRATVRALASAEILPGPLDCETLVPPVQRWWVRRIPGHNLWIFYRAQEDVVYLLLVTRQPPVPLDVD